MTEYSRQWINGQEILEDYSSTGRRRPWKEHKVSNEKLAEVYQALNADKARRLRECCSFLRFAVDPETGRKTLDRAGFCRVRLCPICAWRRSLKTQAQMMAVVEEMSREERPPEYILLTLTVRNVQGEDLSKTLDQMMVGWRRLFETQRVETAVLGWYRSLEVTHNVNPKSKDFDTYHPHFHVLCAVDKRYFKDGRYIPQREWAALWKRSVRLDYDPLVNVKRIKGNDAAAVAEVAKYPVKPGQYVVPDEWDLTLSAVAVLDRALDRRRLLAYGGKIKEIHKRLHLDDPEDGDLIHVEREEKPVDATQMITYIWHSGYSQYLAN